MTNNAISIRPLWTSALGRCVWAERICCGAALTVRMVRANIQYKLSLYLDSRARPDKAGTCDAVSIDNVPSYFPYVVFGQEWVSEREKRCTYCVNSGVHEF